MFELTFNSETQKFNLSFSTEDILKVMLDKPFLLDSPKKEQDLYKEKKSSFGQSVNDIFGYNKTTSDDLFKESKKKVKSDIQISTFNLSDGTEQKIDLSTLEKMLGIKFPDSVSQSNFPDEDDLIKALKKKFKKAKEEEDGGLSS